VKGMFHVNPQIIVLDENGHGTLFEPTPNGVWMSCLKCGTDRFFTYSEIERMEKNASSSETDGFHQS
jgi:RNase P subunit RPR2